MVRTDLLPQDRDFWSGMGLALLLAAGATALRYFCNPALGNRAPFLLHVLAITAAAQIAGTVPGLVATGASTILIRYFFIWPQSFGPPPDARDHVSLLLFALVGVVLSLMGGRRKRVQAELQRIRYNLETAQHLANIGSWESDLGGKLWWSPETYCIFGVEPGEHLRTGRFFELVHPEDCEKVRAAVRQSVESHADYDIEHRIVRKNDGEVRYVHQRAKLIDRGGVHLIGSIEDLTDRKRGEMAQQILGGLLRVCSACRRIHDADTQEWYPMESYLHRHSAARFSHGMCEDCGQQWLSQGGMSRE